MHSQNFLYSNIFSKTIVSTHSSLSFLGSNKRSKRKINPSTPSVHPNSFIDLDGSGNPGFMAQKDAWPFVRDSIGGFCAAPLDPYLKLKSPLTSLWHGASGLCGLLCFKPWKIPLTVVLNYAAM